jgi:HSP20 family protein
MERNVFSPLFGRELDWPFGANSPFRFATANPTFDPDVNVSQDDDGLTVEAEIPGVRQDDLDISVSGQTLTISGERNSDRQDDETVQRSERTYGKFSRSYRLPDQYDTSAVAADYKNGVLVVRVPKRAEAKPRRIAISVT